MSCGVGGDTAQIPPSVAVVKVGSCSSDSTPSLGTSMCRGCGPKEKEKKKKILCPRVREKQSPWGFGRRRKLTLTSSGIFESESHTRQCTLYQSMKRREGKKFTITYKIEEATISWDSFLK